MKSDPHLTRMATYYSYNLFPTTFLGFQCVILRATGRTSHVCRLSGHWPMTGQFCGLDHSHVMTTWPFTEKVCLLLT